MSDLTYEQCQRRDREHLADPKAGDYWQEMFSPVCVVVGRLGDEVVICRTTKDDGLDRWNWDLSRVETMTRAEFAAWLSHKSDGLRDRTWCSVEPGAYGWVRGAAKLDRTA